MAGLFFYKKLLTAGLAVSAAVTKRLVVNSKLVKAAYDLAAFMEAYLALKNGISNSQLQAAVHERKLFYRKKTIAGINFDKVHEDFR